ncbi:MAG: S8 family serine peptidase [Pseudobdellovibrionaceae bacterium]
MKSAVLIIFFLPFFALSQNQNLSANRPQTSTVKTTLGFNNYYLRPHSYRKLKIAVLDKGFQGWQKELGQSLPKTTKYIPGPINTPPDIAQQDHGLRMAQIVTSLLTNDLQVKEFIPELYLYNVYGFSNFKAAIQDLIHKKVDLVLYSEVWDYGGNGDGQGFINQEVNKATKQGIIWINAAGNFEQSTYVSAIESIQDQWVRLPNNNNALEVRCTTDRQKCPLRIVLSWNDFKNDVEQGTNKDLDLALTDDLLNIVATSALKQTEESTDNRPGLSKYPREIIEAEVNPGVYFLRVKNRSQNFSSTDRLRITIDGEGFILPSKTSGSTVLNPADNPNVITVGAYDSDRSSYSSNLQKPDLLTASSITLNDGREFRGSSNAAAIAAAAFALIKLSNPAALNQKQIFSLLRPFWMAEKGLSLNDLQFTPTAGNCFQSYATQGQYPGALPTYVSDFILQGTHLVYTSQGQRLLTPLDPLTWAPDLKRNQYNDMVVLTPAGQLQVFSRWQQIPQGYIEVFQAPQEAQLCPRNTNNIWSKIYLGLPGL